MKLTSAILLSILIFLVGCNSKDRSNIANKSKLAFENAREAASLSIESISREAGMLSERSSLADLQSARDRATEVLQKLEGIKIDVGPFKDKVTGLRREVDRLDAAIAEQRIREQWTSALKAANNGKEVASSNLEKIRVGLKKTDETFRALDDKLIAAERTYRNACNRAKDALPQAENFGSK
jgi:hypothetical protein